MEKFIINCETKKEELIPLTPEEIAELQTVQPEPLQPPTINERVEALEEALLTLLG